MKFPKHIILLLLLVASTGCGHAPGASRVNRIPSQREVAQFHLLRGPSDIMPFAVTAHLAHILAEQLDGPLTAQFVRHAPTAQGTVWVFLTETALCLAQGNRGAVACSTPSRAASDGISLGVFSPPSTAVPRAHDFLLFGLVPDGVRHVRLKIGKRHRTVKVRNNLYSASSDRPILESGWSGRSD